MPYEFDLEKWLPRFPLQDNHGHFSGDQITGPGDICNNELLRRGMIDQFDWGEPVPVDIFVMSDGEPDRRDATKIGGLPYRAASDPWPKTAQGRSMALLAQFNFVDSVDIVGELPGDLLLIFADEGDGEQAPIHYEWKRLGISDLVSEAPDDCMHIEPCYGNRCRTVSYPDAKPRWDVDESYPKCLGKDVRSWYWIPTYQATQIGRAPYYIQQGDGDTPGEPLCTIASVQPDQHQIYPWVNVPEPLRAPGEWSFDDEYLMIGDAGCIYLSMDENGEIYLRESCF